jgi:hypothetical protein
MHPVVKNFLKKISFIATSLISIGFIIILICDFYLAPISPLWGAVILHVGIAIMIAGIINLILELTEIKSFFEERLLSIVAKDEFLDQLTDDTLSEYIHNAMYRLLYKKAPSNLRDHGGICRSITLEVLPALWGVICEDYNDSTDFELLDDDKIKELQLTKNVAKITNSVIYDFIAPNKDDEFDIKIYYWYIVKEINNYPLKEQYEFKLFLTHTDKDEKEEEIEMAKYIKKEEGFAELDFSYDIKLKSYVRCRIECTIITSPPPTHRVVYMRYPTRNVAVHFSSNKPVSPIGEVYGIVPDYTESFEKAHTCTLRYPGWMLEDQGYFIKWDAKWLEGPKG